MVVPLPNKVNGDVFYSTDVHKFFYAAPYANSVVIEGGKVGSGILITADWGTAAPADVNASGCAYICVGSTQTTLPPVASVVFINYTGNYARATEHFTFRHFTSGMAWANSVWIACTASNWYQYSSAPSYLLIQGV